ncbi:hypothetical protein LTR10_023258 [Elasticomyces elasticus]|uniref:Uncharacterized protein n=1 Tax=Exophiala sideris TaxID=1016849 RepID=A0ABR0J2L8_9EURO|nr:hypothetical protein LTR10_023258 [Elasticomyces elasticus]KAK5024750.1 hypothetical protein LTS07_008596 [Exophiala sideris]KAK5030843.1 hypothetical protein LTR13_008197 [Exophiala sideris]KAK5054385.1 hypothetical protein LTR69_009000 [Exophiala sideris]KAK5179785.1 hypothetical protein LTR44_007953 [Eurotiomycetes sp. CCFEE 6388]
MDAMIVDEPARNEQQNVLALPIRARPSEFDGEDTEMRDDGPSDTESVDIKVDPEFAETAQPSTELFEEDSEDDAQNVARNHKILIRVVF